MHVFPVEGDVVVLPQQPDGLAVFAEAADAGFAFDAQGGELGIAVAQPDAENEAAIGEVVQRGGFLGQQHGVQHWQQQHRGAQPHPLPQMRQIAQHWR